MVHQNKNSQLTLNIHLPKMGITTFIALPQVYQYLLYD